MKERRRSRMLRCSGLALSETIDISLGLASSSSSKTERKDERLDSPTVWFDSPSRLSFERLRVDKLLFDKLLLDRLRFEKDPLDRIDRLLLRLWEDPPFRSLRGAKKPALPVERGDTMLRLLMLRLLMVLTVLTLRLLRLALVLKLLLLHSSPELGAVDFVMFEAPLRLRFGTTRVLPSSIVSASDVVGDVDAFFAFETMVVRRFFGRMRLPFPERVVSLFLL
jgi:hypothetical protein